MIVVYPMLTSSSVSPNVIPGIAKAVEKYLILYNIDEILREVNINIGKSVKTGVKFGITLAARGRLQMKEGVEVKILDEQGSSTKNPKKPSTAKGKGTLPKGSGGAKPELRMPKTEAISLEPTWVQITTKKKGLQILGVKVIPFKVESAESMIEMIMKDKQLKVLNYLATNLLPVR